MKPLRKPLWRPVALCLHGPKGDVNGALLASGVIVRLPPPEASRFGRRLDAGQPLAVRGEELRTAIGAVIEAREIGASQDRLDPEPPSPPPPPPKP